MLGFAERRDTMVTFEDLQRANESIRTTDIKGKDYAEVNQRIKAFRMVYPDGFIRTELIRLTDDGMCIFKAQCGYYIESKRYENVGLEEVILGTGTAYEKEDSSFINKTSYIENCETSAVGRALGMAGFGIDTSICSAEELGNALLNQEGEKPITKGNVKSLVALAERKGSDLSEICDYFGVGKLEEMTAADYGKCLLMLNKKEDVNG